MDSPTFEYNNALAWLYSQLPMFSRVGAAAYKPGLDNTERLDEIFGHPHRRFKTIHIGGTNGKGSTSHSIAAVLQAQGYKTGLYTSPHLVDFRERIRIDGKMVPKDYVAEFVERWRSLETDLKPSFFELTMMMAFCWFAEQEVDYAVIEVGMGGRLDSTNIITPLLSVITNISFDHTQFLGETLAAIAGEKAGIIKPGVPAVIGRAEGEVREVFEKRGIETGTTVTFAEESHTLSDVRVAEQGWECTLGNGAHIRYPLGGICQKENLRTVLASLETLRKIGVKIDGNSVKQGLENLTTLTGLRGRWEKVRETPDVICDTGHNIDGLCQNMETLRRRYPDKRIKFVLGFVSDKDVPHIVSLFPNEAEFYFTRPSIPRAMDVETAASHFANAGIKGKKFDTVEEAYKAALKSAKPEDVIYVGGSTFVVADLLASLS